METEGTGPGTDLGRVRQFCPTIFSDRGKISAGVNRRYGIGTAEALFSKQLPRFADLNCFTKTVKLYSKTLEISGLVARSNSRRLTG